MRRYAILVVALLYVGIGTVSAQRWPQVQNVFGLTGHTENGALQFGFPRSDQHPSIKGVNVEPDLATASIFAFQRLSGNRALVTAEFVLLESEVSAVQSRLEAGGFSIAALHNHLLMETPRFLFMHASAQGNPARLAQTLRAALATTKTPLKPTDHPATTTWSDIESVLRHTGTRSGPMLMVSIPTRSRVSMNGVTMAPGLDPSHDINFQRTATNRAVGAGEIACTTGQVQTVIKMLKVQGMSVTAVHNHFLTENPRLIYVHYWASGKPVTIARSVRMVLDRVGAK